MSQAHDPKLAQNKTDQTVTVTEIRVASPPLPGSRLAATGPASGGISIGLPPDYESAVLAVLEAAERIRRNWYEKLKRAIDVGFSLLFLIAGAPLFLGFAVCIKLSSPGPVFFRHRRLGRRGKEFWCYKFRTMVQDAELQLQRDTKLRRDFERNFKLKDDPRVTRFGALLRRSSLDELPQLWNVLRGDISLVGPRPIVTAELAKYGRYAEDLLEVTPGLSGLWQVCGRSETTYEQRIQLDMLYIQNRSTWLDLKLLGLTFFAVFRKLGAY